MTQHKADVRPNPQEAYSDYKFEAFCSCQWQALARTTEAAKNFIRGHLAYHNALIEDKIEPAPEVEETSGGQVPTN